jgi:ABC-type lipoprotein export system ATPase subunit
MISLAKREQSSLLLVTHSLAVAGKADRIITLEDGQVTEQSSA